MPRIKTFSFNCPVASVQARVTHTRYEVSGIGDDLPASQSEHECEQEDACAERGLLQRCPIRLRDIGTPASSKR